jgi:hypothetical protein
LDNAYGTQSSNGKQPSFPLAAKNKTPELTGSRMKRDPLRNLIPRLLAAGCLAVVLTSSIGCRGLNHWCHELRGCVSNQEIVPMPEPEVIIPEAAGTITPNETNGATLTIESPSDATVAFPESAPNLSENINAETDQLIPADSGLQVPNSPPPVAAVPVSVQSANQDAESTSTQPVTDAAELSFTFE